MPILSVVEERGDLRTGLESVQRAVTRLSPASPPRMVVGLGLPNLLLMLMWLAGLVEQGARPMVARVGLAWPR